jgi:hypothetical protein
MSKNAPAFPVALGTQDDQHECGFGLTKREYFAAAALTGWLAHPETTTDDPERMAIVAYIIADAMLTEGEKG